MPDIEIFADIDEACRSQLAAISALPPFEASKIRLMPDAHSGVNSIVGFTATIQDKVIPSIVGGDIGCGVLAIQIKKPKKGIDFNKLDKAIRSAIPNGTGQVRKSVFREFDFDHLECWETLPNKHVIPLSLGSLGAGNHFIAIDQDDDKNLWLVIHTGSRNLGTKIAEHYQEIAGSRRGTEISENIAYSMSWLEGDDMQRYLQDMDSACEFAASNRRAIADIIMKECGFKERDAIESVHNYIDTENMIIRKGAIDASKDRDVIIPLNMATGCVIGKGLGNANWNESAPHGAGRAMTRKEARETISMSDYKSAMNGTWSSCIGADTIDESPAAYKDPNDVLDRSSETVATVSSLREIYNFKAPTKE